MPDVVAKIVRGDFQTPDALAEQVCQRLQASGVCPSVLVEPTCGTGAFLRAARETWGVSSSCFGFDIEPEYVVQAAQTVPDVRVRTQDFFDADWHGIIRDLPPGRLLFLGNPPWVTNAGQGVLGGANLPQKTNLFSFTGLDAKTGKSNFDVSEWMLLRLIDAGLAAGRAFDVAMLCKTGTARKVLATTWRKNLPVADAAIYAVDAGHWFGAAVEACLLHVRFDIGTIKPVRAAREYANFSDQKTSVFGYADGALIADMTAYEATKHLPGRGVHRFRSGVKHDLAKVMELREESGVLWNGFGDVVDIESERVYPLLKCTDLFHGRHDTGRYVLLSQCGTGEDTETLRDTLPRTWAYLNRYRALFAARQSSIYRKQPAFALFGIGAYTFAPYKVAVSGLHGNVRFRYVPATHGKPVVFDDTCYFVGFNTEAEARQLLARCESSDAQQAIAAYLFSGAKRPVTAELLNRLPLG